MLQSEPSHSKKDLSQDVDSTDHKNVHKYHPRKQVALTVLKNHVTDFWNNISLPGFKYVGEPGRHRSDRYIWILVLMLSLVVSTDYITDAYKKWQGSPVLLSFNDSLTPISLIPFPAVTFCPARHVESKADILDIAARCGMFSENCTQEESQILSAARLLCPKSELLTQEEISEKYHTSELNQYIENMVVSCEEVISWFKFNRDEYAEVLSNHTICSRYFQTLYLDGPNVCFTFNMLPAKEIFKPGVIPPVVDQTNFAMKKSWSPDVMLVKTDLEQTVPRYIDSNGRWAGLYIGIINFTTRYDDICGEQLAVPKMLFHSPAELPMAQSHQAVDLPVHKQLFLRVSPSVVTASPELDEYTPLNRRCYFSHERPLALFKLYTQRNCQFECRVNCSLSLCDCVPFFFPRINNSVKICGKEYRTSCSPFLITGILEGRFSWRDILWDFRNTTGQRIQDMFDEYQWRFNKTGKELTDEVVESWTPACSCDCPAACTSLGYEVKVEEGEPLHPSLLTDEFSRMAISFKELEFTSVLRKELIGLTDFIANSGGVLGVFTGFSFLALCELIYYLTLRLWSTIKHTWDSDDLLMTSQRAPLRCCVCCGPVVSE